jgi:hypothetical protein
MEMVAFANQLLVVKPVLMIELHLLDVS